MRKMFLLLANLLICNYLISADYTITDFGATENELATKAIQQAVDACFLAGGGTVIIPRGTFITGTVVLKSNVTIYLEPGALLLGSKNLDDYLSTFRTHGIFFVRMPKM
jgi:polygalacturonase